MKEQSSKNAGHDRFVRAWDERGQYWVEYDTQSKTHQYLDANGNEVAKANFASSDYQYQYDQPNARWIRSLDHGHWTQVWVQNITSNIWTSQNSAPPNPDPIPGDGTLRNFDPNLASPTQIGFVDIVDYESYVSKDSSIEPWNPSIAKGFPETLPLTSGETVILRVTGANLEAKIVTAIDEGFIFADTYSTIATGLTQVNASQTFNLGNDRFLFILESSNSGLHALIKDFSAGLPTSSNPAVITTNDVARRSLHVREVGNSKKLVSFAGNSTGSRAMNILLIDYSGAVPALAGSVLKKTSGAFAAVVPGFSLMHDLPVANTFRLLQSLDHTGGTACQARTYTITVDSATNALTLEQETGASIVNAGYAYGYLKLDSTKYFMMIRDGTNNVKAGIYDISTMDFVGDGLQEIMATGHPNTISNYTGRNLWGTKSVNGGLDLVFVDSNFVYKFRLNAELTAFNYWQSLLHAFSHTSSSQTLASSPGQSFPFPAITYDNTDPRNPTLKTYYGELKLHI